MLQSKSNWKFTIPENHTWLDDFKETSPVIKELLSQRGIATAQEAHQFLNPDLSQLQNPIGLDAIEKASERVHTAIGRNEKILVFGDYDADGVTSTTVLLKALQELGADCDFYIPNRFEEGYGPNEAAFAKAVADGFTLIITVDTGITSVYEAKVAKQLGIDLIITDHHEIQEELPDAYAIIHPKCSPNYLFKELAGVGVAFKFAHQLLGYFPDYLLDLVAIGTVADMVPLIDENRILTVYGLKKLTLTKRPGLKALKTLCKIEGHVTEEDIGFSIGPRLNAVGRLQDADLAVQLLMTEDQDEAEHLADLVHSLNKERQQIVSTIVREAEKKVDPNQTQGVIIVAEKGWNEGVLGIVASRLVKKYDRPAIVMAINEEASVAKGSARSIPAFDLFKNCMQIRGLFNKFGGHAQAAGMTIPLENVEQVQSELNHLISQQLNEKDYQQVIEISKSLNIPEINEELVNEISQLAPFGMANPKPVFHIENIPYDARQLGSMRNHLKLQFRHEKQLLEGIGFGMGHLYPHISPKTSLSIVGELGINEWNGNKKVQMVMHDMKVEEWQLFDHRGKKQTEILPYIQMSKHNVILSGIPIDKAITESGSNIQYVTYGSNTQDLEKADTLFIFDMPTDLTQLKEIIMEVKPFNIHVCFYVETSAYLTTFPSRDDFKWFYALIWKRKKLDLKKEITMLMDTKGWTKNNIIFMSKVFLELEFVKIENGVIQLNSTPIKQDLQASRLYQERLNQADIEKTLYYSTYDDLKAWFENCMDYLDMPEEEVTYGL